MRILQFCKKLPFPAKDGETIAVLNLSEAFADSGQDVTIFALNTRKHFSDPALIPSELSSRMRFESVPVDNRIHPAYLLRNLLSGRPMHLDRFVSKEAEKRLAGLLDELQPDVVQLEGLFALQYAELIGKHSDALLAFRAHNVESQIWMRQAAAERNPLRAAYVKLQAARLGMAERNLVGLADAVVGISPADLEVLDEWSGGKPSIHIPAGIVAERWERSGIRQADVDLFHLGALDWPPNQEGLRWFMDQVLPELGRESAVPEFHIAGRNQAAWMKSWGRRKGVELHGAVANAPDFYGRHHIMVVPLLSGSGMRIKIIEAMAAGCPVVSTSIGAEGLGATDGEHLLIADSAADFARQIRRLMDGEKESKLAGELRNNAAEFVRREFDHRSIGNRLLEFYRSLGPR